MAEPEIRRTVITPDGVQTFVELQISDAPLLDESAGTQITLSIRVASFEFPHLAHLEIAALEAAIETMTKIKSEMQQGLNHGGHAFHPRPAKQK